MLGSNVAARRVTEVGKVHFGILRARSGQAVRNIALISRNEMVSRAAISLRQPAFSVVIAATCVAATSRTSTQGNEIGGMAG
jgi:hypothetical protein